MMVSYDDTVKDIAPEDFSKYFEAAEDYNERLRQNPIRFQKRAGRKAMKNIERG